MEDLLIKEVSSIKKQDISAEVIDWDDLSSTSDYLALLKIQEQFKKRNYSEVEKGLEDLVGFFSRVEKGQIQSLLKELMVEIMMSKNKPELLEDGEWAVHVEHLREDIAYSKEIHYFDINDDFLKSDSCQDFAIKWATARIETEFGSKAKMKPPTWKELFEIDYLDNIKVEGYE